MARSGNKYYIFHIVDNCIEYIHKPYTNKVQALRAYRELVTEMFTQFDKREVKQAVDNNIAMDEYSTLSFVTLKE